MKRFSLLISMFAIATTFGATAQTTETRMNTTLTPQAWSDLPIVKSEHVKGGMHNLGTLNLAGGASNAINTNGDLTAARRTEGMVVTFTDQTGAYKQYLLADDKGNTDKLDDVWQEIYVTQDWVAGGSYAKGQLVMHNNGMYVAKDAISNDAAFDGADFWTLLDESGNSAINGISVASISVAGTEINAITTTKDGITADGSTAIDGNNLVTSKAVYDFVTARVASVEEGTTAGQVLVWDGGKWAAADPAKFKIDLANGITSSLNFTTTGAVSAASITTTGDATIGGNAAITGNTTVGGDATVTGTVNAGTADVTGALTAGSVTTAGAVSAATLATTGNATVGGAATVTGALSAGSITTGGDLTIGSNTVNGITQSGGTLAANNNKLITEAAVKEAIENSAQNINLADGKILIGGTDGKAAAQTMSGDVTMSNTGVTTIGTSKVVTTMIADANVTNEKLADGSVTSAKIGEGEVKTINILNDAVTAAKLNADVAGVALSQNGTTGALDVNTDGVTVEVNGSNAIQIKDGGVSTAKIADGAVTFDKLNAEAVVTSTEGIQASTSASDAKTVTEKAVAKFVEDKMSSAIENGTAPNQTLRWDGTKWVTSGALTNDGTNIATTGNVTVGTGLTVSTGGASITGNSTLTGNLGVTGTATIDGATTINNTLNVSGASTLNSAAIANNATVGGTLGVTGAATIDGGATIANGATVSTGNLAVTAGNLTVGGTTTLTGATTMAGGATITGGANVTGATVLNTSLAFSDANTVNGITISTNAGTLAATDEKLITEGAVKKYVETQMGISSTDKLYYGSGSFGSAPSNEIGIESGTAVDKANIYSATSFNPNVANGTYYWVAYPEKWGEMSMFLAGNKVIDGFVKKVVGKYQVFVFQFAVPSAAGTINLTLASN